MVFYFSKTKLFLSLNYTYISQKYSKTISFLFLETEGFLHLTKVLQDYLRFIFKTFFWYTRTPRLTWLYLSLHLKKYSKAYLILYFRTLVSLHLVKVLLRYIWSIYKKLYFSTNHQRSLNLWLHNHNNVWF